MPDDSNNQDESRRPERPERENEAPAKGPGMLPFGNQNVVADALAPGAELDSGQATPPPPNYPDSLLGDRGTYGRANAPVRTAIAQRLQMTYGNRAAQRMLQRLAAGESAVETPDIAGEIQSKSGSGDALDENVRRRLESGIGADMSGVRVHTGPEADTLARSVDAVAFTTGQDIFFREGTYNPGSSEGMRLLAHEATHTVQQSKGPVSGTPVDGGVSVSDPSDAFEQEAEHTAEKVASQPAPSAQAGTTSSRAVQTQRSHNRKDDDDLPESGLVSAPAGGPQEQQKPDNMRDTERTGELLEVPEAEAGEESEVRIGTGIQRSPVGTTSRPGGTLPVQRDGDKGASEGTATTTIEEPERETYDVEADTLEDFVKAVSKRKEAGDTEWNPVYNYDQVDGKVTNVTVTVKIKVTMPKWAGASKLGPKAKAEWDRFYKALEEHEQGHVKIAQEKFKDLAEKMKGKKEAAAKQEFAKAKKAAKDASDKYDKSNDHGKKQGTIINEDAGKDDPKPKSSSTSEATPGSTVPPQAEATSAGQPENEEEETAVG